MSKRANHAVENHRNGCNCAQAVAIAFADVMNMDEEQVGMISSPFGGGIGGLGEVCGAVTGMLLAYGTQEGYRGAIEVDRKEQVNNNTKRLVNQFHNKYDTIICRELIQRDEDANCVEKRPCEKYVRDAAEILASELKLD